MKYHGQAHALVRIDEVGEDLGGCGDGDATLVSELVEAALHAQIGQPVLAVLGGVSTSIQPTWGEVCPQQRHRPWCPAGSC